MFPMGNDCGVAPGEWEPEAEEPDPRDKPMSDVGKFVFDLAQDIQRVYVAGMKAGKP